MSDVPLVVRTIQPDEWERLKAIRLEALEDTPTAYTTTLEEAAAYDDSVWIERAVAGSNGKDQITVIAVDGDVAVGMAVGLLRSRMRPDVVPIVSVYVAPQVRRTGVARRLMDLVEEWARSRGAHTTSLWVVEDNGSARRFYEALGYEVTGDRQIIRTPPERWETRLIKNLDP